MDWGKMLGRVAEIGRVLYRVERISNAWNEEGVIAVVPLKPNTAYHDKMKRLYGGQFGPVEVTNVKMDHGAALLYPYFA